MEPPYGYWCPILELPSTPPIASISSCEEANVVSFHLKLSNGIEINKDNTNLNGTIRLWYINNITDMRLDKYRLFEIAKAQFRNPYNGDAFSFLSKNRRTLKIVRYENHKVILYDECPRD